MAKYFPTKKVVCCSGYLIHGLYYVDNMSNNNEPQSNMKAMLIEYAFNSQYLWHLRLCHIAEDRINKLERMGILSNLESASNSTCESCLQGKMTRSPFVGQMARAKDILEIIHSDVCGPFREIDRKSTRLNSSHSGESRMPSSA